MELKQPEIKTKASLLYSWFTLLRKRYLVISLALFTLNLSCSHLWKTKAEHVPINFLENELGGGQVFVPCKINEQAFENCFFDSGATSTMLSSKVDFVEFFGFVGIRGSSGEVKQCRQVKLSKIELGLISKLNVTGESCTDEPHLVTLGMDILSYTKFIFDVNEHRFFLPLSIDISEGQSLIQGASGHLIMAVNVNGEEVLALWDTGAGTSVISTELLDGHKQDYKYSNTVMAVDVTGTERSIPVYQSSNLKIGGYNVGLSNFLVRDFSITRKNVGQRIDMILGMNIIKNFSWTFDTQTQLWKISD